MKKGNKKISTIEVEKKTNLADLVLISPLEDAKSGLSTTFKLIISALTLVAALAWNEAIKSIFETFGQYISGADIWGKLIYALLITFVTVIIIDRIEKIQASVIKAEVKKELAKEKNKK
jgi:Flp pilus assembly pilin Flp